MIWPIGSNSGKVVFTLLIEVIILHIELITINVRGFDVELIPK